MKNIFKKSVSDEIIVRINSLSVDSQPKWGKMTSAQMFAHCSVTYEMEYSDKYKKPNFLMKFILKNFVKKLVVGEKPYKKNSRTAPIFLITDKREYELEKEKLVGYITKTQILGENHFNKKESHSFGVLNINEWNNMFYKHLNHHLEQFGA